MTAVAVASAQAAPGASTVALGIAATWPAGNARLVECDADGGVVAARFGLGLDPGVASLAAAHRHPDLALGDHVQQLPGGLPVVVCPPGPAQARAAVSLVADRLADQLVSEAATVVDVGRGRPETGPLLTAVDRVVLVVRGRGEEVAAAAGWLAASRLDADVVGVVVVDTGPYSPSQVAAALDVGLVGVVPWDPAGAARLYGAGSARRLARTPLIRACRSIAATLAADPMAARSVAHVGVAR